MMEMTMKKFLLNGRKGQEMSIFIMFILIAVVVFIAFVLYGYRTLGVFENTVEFTGSAEGGQRSLAYRIASAPCISLNFGTGEPLKFVYDSALLDAAAGFTGTAGSRSSGKPLPCVTRQDFDYRVIVRPAGIGHSGWLFQDPPLGQANRAEISPTRAYWINVVGKDSSGKRQTYFGKIEIQVAIPGEGEAITGNIEVQSVDECRQAGYTVQSSPAVAKTASECKSNCGSKNYCYVTKVAPDQACYCEP